MSAGSQIVSGRTQNQVVLGELLHSLSQPLTTLRCSLELSVENIAGQPQDVVSSALEQTDRVIAVVRLMREYLDTESATTMQPPVPLGPVLRGVVENLAPVAGERQVRLQLTGGCSATIALPEPRLRLALQYLIGILIEGQPQPGEVTLRLEQGAAESELRAHGAGCAFDTTAPSSGSNLDSAHATLHRVQLAIARRLLESAGATLELDGDGHSGFLLHVPRPLRPVHSNFSPDNFAQ